MTTCLDLREAVSHPSCWVKAVLYMYMLLFVRSGGATFVLAKLSVWFGVIFFFFYLSLKGLECLGDKYSQKIKVISSPLIKDEDKNLICI